MNKNLIKSILSGDDRGVLGINRRNIGYVYTGNVKKFFGLADRKLETKNILDKAGLPHPKTITTFSEFRETIELETRLEKLENFVIKPDKGKMGSGIMVLAGQMENGFLDAGGEFVEYRKIKKRIADIILGVFSNGLDDTAIIEERIFPDSFFNNIYSKGLSDIRVIAYKKEPVMSMIRVPTGTSGGRANLHQGGVGIAIDMASGTTYAASIKGESITTHPDTGAELIGLKVPFFREILNMTKELPDEVRLNYIGFDFAVDKTRGPMIIEINARPGLEIQNIGGLGLYSTLLDLERKTNE